MGHVVDFRPANVYPPTFEPGPNRNSIELAGAFLQASYRFAPGNPAAAKPAVFSFIPTKTPAPATTYDWTGCYAGVEGGGTWGESKQIGQTIDRNTFDSTPEFHVDGGLLGGTVGYNSQFNGIWAFGVEGDMSWVDARGSANQIPPFLVSQVATTKEDWLATARARFGLTPVDRWLVYGTGGVAVADVAAGIANASGTTAFPEESHVRPGWTAGGGVEAAIVGNWSAKLEYLYVGLENHAYFVPTPNNPHLTNRAGGVPLNDNIVRGGINYKINWL